MSTLSSTTTNTNTLPFRPVRKDVGVGIIVSACLLLGMLLRTNAQDTLRTFAPEKSTFRIAYPSKWVEAEALLDAPLLKMEDPATNSAYKTNLSVDMRELDTTTPPTIQQLLDQRVEELGTRTGYHFLSQQDTTVAGEKAIQFEYAHVVQPIDLPRAASLPVVVRSREYVVITKDRAYYIALAAPANEFDNAQTQFERVIQTVKF